MISKYKSTAAPLSDHERELVTILIEECGEVIQAATKMARFGKDDCYPDSKITNSKQLGLEIGDLYHMCMLLEKMGLITRSDIVDGEQRKQEKLAVYLQTE